MAYNQYTLSSIKRTFGLHLKEDITLFAGIKALEVSAELQALLDETIPLALAINTEKARSELIIAPILVEVRRILKRQISLFSGVEFNIDPDQGLTGVCDFIISQSPEQLLIDVPVLMIVEAKNDNIKAGLAQCIAEMLAAQVYNEREGTRVTIIHGVVTTGSIWRFLRLEQQTVFIDTLEYYLESLGTLLGILTHIASGAAAQAATPQ